MDNLTVCIYAVSNGHWDKKDCYLRTITDLESHKVNFADKIAHIKIRPGEEEFADIMEKDFISFGYRVLKTVSPWKRWHGSHAVEQLKDIFTVFNETHSEFIFHVEDDWVLRPLYQNLEFWLKKSIELLETNPEVIQVRIPRQINEFEHFKSMEKVDGNWKKQGELFSLNPHIIKRADLEKVLINVISYQEKIIPMLENQQLNVELLFADFGRMLRPSGKPFWSHSSENIRALHIGNNGPDDSLEKVY